MKTQMIVVAFLLMLPPAWAGTVDDSPDSANAASAASIPQANLPSIVPPPVLLPLPQDNETEPPDSSQLFPAAPIIASPIPPAVQMPDMSSPVVVQFPDRHFSGFAELSFFTVVTVSPHPAAIEDSPKISPDAVSREEAAARQVEKTLSGLQASFEEVGAAADAGGLQEIFSSPPPNLSAQAGVDAFVDHELGAVS